MLFALVATRAIASGSKLAAGEWASRDVVVPDLPGLDGSSQALRALGLLVESEAEGAAQECVFFAAAHVLNLEVDLRFFDITSTCFERDGEDEEAGDEAFRRFGHSKACSRSSSGSRSPAKASRSAAGAGPATPPTPP
ncbi:hypothetical protein WJ438_04355 [Streptomyces sp. GD-15H]|uniref:hypothetical protein n=1 Tax=Streptomyces sp. GD-15H TaxID=3129112 RepID=UPI003255A377